MVTPSKSSADENLIYLRCKADSSYVGEPSILIDKEKKTITILPIKDGLPLSENETTYEGKLIVEGKLVTQISVDKFTLRYHFQSLWDSKGSVGQCSLENKKI